MTGPVPAPAATGVYPDAESFFDLYLSELFARHPRLPWCVHWQEHHEADAIVGALWRTWEVAQLNPVDGMAVWLRDYAYPLLFDRLAVPEGTFSGCSWKEEIHEPNTLPLPRHGA